MHSDNPSHFRLMAFQAIPRMLSPHTNLVLSFIEVTRMSKHHYSLLPLPAGREVNTITNANWEHGNDISKLSAT